MPSKLNRPFPNWPRNPSIGRSFPSSSLRHSGSKRQPSGASGRLLTTSPTLAASCGQMTSTSRPATRARTRPPLPPSAPAPVRSLRDRHGCAGPACRLAAATLAHRKPCLPVDAVERYPGFRGPTGTTVPPNSGSRPSPPVQAGCAGGGRQTGAALTTVHAIDFVVRTVGMLALASRGDAHRTAGAVLQIPLRGHGKGHGGFP